MGIKHQVWTHQPGEVPHRLDAVREIWINLGLLDDNGALTLAGINAAEDGLPLFEYYLMTLFDLLDADYSNPPYNENFQVTEVTEQLRQQALENFHRRYISPFFWPALGFANVPGYLIDVGGGAGHYSRDWVHTLDGRAALVIDLHPTDDESNIKYKSLDATTDESWVTENAKKADVVLMSEFLITKSKEAQYKLVGNCKKVLAPGGSLVVNERHPTASLKWRTAVLTSHGCVLGSREIAELLTSHGFTQTHSWRSSSHQATRWLTE